MIIFDFLNKLCIFTINSKNINILMRKEIPKEDKKITISVSLHEKLDKMLEKYSKENNINKSKIIQNLLKDYFNKNK